MANETLNLKDLQQGERFQVVADAYTYNFAVLNPGELPTCMLEQINPDGTKVGPLNVIVEGLGHWTNKRQNPVQQQERALTIGRGMLETGCTVVLLSLDPKNHGRYELEPPATSITVLPSRTT